MKKNKRILPRIFWVLVIGIPITGFTDFATFPQNAGNNRAQHSNGNSRCTMDNIHPSQVNNLLKLKLYFEGDLESWTNSFYNFKLADFRLVDTIGFSPSQRKDFNNYNDFLSVYKPILTYSADSSQFIDIYSVQLNIRKNENYYEANPNGHQGIYLCNPQSHYWSIIYSGMLGEGIDEVVWISRTEFILVGIEHASNGPQSLPVILLGDTDSQRFERYRSPDQSCFQDNQGYQSSKLMKMNISNL